MNVFSISYAENNNYVITFYPIGLNASKGYDADDNNLSENLVLNFTPNAHDISTPNVTLDITSDVYNISIHTMHNFLAPQSDFTWLNPCAKPFYPCMSLCNSARLNPNAAPFSPCFPLYPNTVPFTSFLQ